MSNNKQSSVDAIIKFMKENQYFIGNDLYQFFEQAKEMEVAGKEMSYGDGYSEGYKRALDYMTMSIKNAIANRNNESNT